MTAARPIRVVIADDSPTARALLGAVLDADADITVVGEAVDGAEALELTKQLCPSLVVMDIEMPRMDGFDATKRIMIEQPTPIIVVSARYDTQQVEVGLRAVRAGALAVVAKPTAPPGTPGAADHSRRLITLIKALADVKVVRQRHASIPATPQVPPPASPKARSPWRPGSLQAVGVAASTGGPAALYRFLEALPRTLDVPVLVVQHIANGFVGGLASWLGGATVLPVCVAEHDQELVGGQIYVAPDDRHLEVAGGRGRLSDTAPVGGFRPAADVLFSSLAESYGVAAAAVVLTGMGHDGLDGAARVRAAGGLVLAQDADSSVVFGMPRAVARAGLADVVGPVEELASRVARLSCNKEVQP